MNIKFSVVAAWDFGREAQTWETRALRNLGCSIDQSIVNQSIDLAVSQVQ